MTRTGAARRAAATCLLVLLGQVSAFAQSAETAAAQKPLPAKSTPSCAYFSPDPDDRSGPPIRFFADISADEQSAVTESPGIGRVDFTLDRKTLRLEWTVRFSRLSSAPVGLHVHGPQTPGTEAGALFDLAPPNAIRDGVRGSKILDDGLLGYLVQDRLYVNLHTRKYPAGELRGHVRKARPDCAASKIK